MVVITQKRFKGQDGRPTNLTLLKALNNGTLLEKIPHRYYFPKEVLKNFIKVKKMVLKNKAAYLKSKGGNKLTSAVIIIDGKSGSGKSTIASQVGLFFDPYITLEKNYAWNMDRLMELIENPKVGDCIILDEGMIFNSRKANSDDNIRLIVALSQVRSKGVFFIICINSVHQLEKSIPLSRADFLIHVKRIGGMTGIPQYSIYDSDRMKQLIIKNAGKYSYKGIYPNIDWRTFSRYLFADEVRYDNMKHKESLKNIQNKKNNSSDREAKIRIALMKLIEYCRENEVVKKYTEFSKITGLASNTLSDYKRKYEMELKK